MQKVENGGLGVQPVIPEYIKTERLLLRRPMPADLEPFLAFYQSPRSAMAMGPVNRAEAYKMFCLELGLWQIKGYGNHSVLLDDVPIGLVGIWHPEDWDEPELGWLLWEGYEGQGYATEAAFAVYEVVSDLGWPAPVSYIDPANTASQALARRLGATLEGPHPRWSETEAWRHRRR